MRLPAPPWRTLRTLALAAVGAAIGLALAGQITAPIGPFDATFRARPSFEAHSRVHLPPLGSLLLDTHRGPIALDVRVDELRAEEASRIAADPSVLEDVDDELAGDARSALRGLALRSVVAVVVGGLVGGLVSRFALVGALQGGALGVVAATLIGGGVAVSFRAEAVREPEYHGLLAAAPQAVGDVASLVERFDDYSAQLSDLVRNVVVLYRTADALPGLDPGDDVVRVLHISDIHNNPQGFDLAEAMADQFDVAAVIDSGDITDWGTDPESLLLERVEDFDVPYVFVRGNHDSSATEEAMAGFGAVVLDGDAVEVAGLRIWGIGDPRFTPDQQTDGSERISPAFARRVRAELRADGAATVDIAVVHDPASGAELGGVVPLVLAGHRHRTGAEVRDGTLFLTEGSTGGAGLRALKRDEPVPLTCTVLHFSRSGRLIAYDRISVEGFGGAAARIERHVVEPTPPEEE